MKYKTIIILSLVAIFVGFAAIIYHSIVASPYKLDVICKFTEDDDGIYAVVYPEGAKIYPVKREGKLLFRIYDSRNSVDELEIFCKVNQKWKSVFKDSPIINGRYLEIEILKDRTNKTIISEGYL